MQAGDRRAQQRVEGIRGNRDDHRPRAGARGSGDPALAGANGDEAEDQQVHAEIAQ